MNKKHREQMKYICDKSCKRQESGQKAILGELMAENIQRDEKI